MDLPSSKFSWHEKSISERLGSYPSSGATISRGSDSSPPSKTCNEHYINHGEVCQVLNIIILCHIKYLDYFWCIKYQYKNIYVKMGKRKWEKEKEKGFLANWARGEIRPSQVASARGQAGRRPSSACQREWHHGRGPTCQRGGENGVRGVTGGSTERKTGRRSSTTVLCR